jgi:hypothetical protein
VQVRLVTGTRGVGGSAVAGLGVVEAHVMTNRTDTDNGYAVGISTGLCSSPLLL